MIKRGALFITGCLGGGQLERWAWLWMGCDWRNGLVDQSGGRASSHPTKNEKSAGSSNELLHWTWLPCEPAWTANTPSSPWAKRVSAWTKSRHPTRDPHLREQMAHAASLILSFAQTTSSSDCGRLCCVPMVDGKGHVINLRKSP